MNFPVDLKRNPQDDWYCQKIIQVRMDYWNKKEEEFFQNLVDRKNYDWNEKKRIPENGHFLNLARRL